jgi:hypothetical protein
VWTLWKSQEAATKVKDGAAFQLSGSNLRPELAQSVIGTTHNLMTQTSLSPTLPSGRVELC